MDAVAWQEVDLGPLGLTQQQVNDAVQWVAADGTVRSGHQAIATLLRSAGGVWQPTGRLMELPGISWMAASAYRVISKNRHRLPGSSPACAFPTGRRRQPRA